MEIDFIQELKKRDELLDGYLRQIEIQEEFIQKQKELIECLEDHISKITDIVLFYAKQRGRCCANFKVKYYILKRKN